MVWAYTLNFDGVGSDVFVVVVLGSMLFVSSDMSSLHHPTPRNALFVGPSVRPSVGPSHFLPPSNAHAHQSDL